MSDDGSTPPTGKSKQERIRDNQRRSRARRQEYLADLERRLSECHITCREADLQRDTFGQLQQENHRLRELLVYAGVHPDLIESYVSQDFLPTSEDPNSSFRKIKPKISTAETSKATVNTSEGSCRPGACGPTSASSCSTPTVTGPVTVSASATGPKNSTMNPANYMTFPASSGSVSSSTPNLGPSQSPAGMRSTDFDWLYQQQQHQQQTLPNFSSPQNLDDNNYLSQSFKSPSYDFDFPASQNTVLYSLAKDMIERYGVTPQEMEEIKARLYPSFSQPADAFPEQDVGVDQQVLFDILNELSRKHS